MLIFDFGVYSPFKAKHYFRRVTVSETGRGQSISEDRRKHHGGVGHRFRLPIGVENALCFCPALMHKGTIEGFTHSHFIRASLEGRFKLEVLRE